MVKPKKILNDPDKAVDEFIQGLLLQYPNSIRKLQNHHVLLKANLTPQVQLLSGGGSGHEPSHAGWIGDGMLSGAICGGIFASPSVSAILAAIRAVHTGQGVLLIVKNYTGDRLNFGMAAERANQEGINCQMVVVADDVAMDRQKGITGARGVAGTVLVHKVAGAAAALGKSLPEVAALAQLTASQMGSLGIALNSVTVPGADETNTRLENDNIEIGLGIHGEAGRKQSPLLSADDMAREMVTSIQAYGRCEQQDLDSIVPMVVPGDQIAILVNNLGGTSNFEMSILAQSCVKLLESGAYGCKVTHVFVGAYMTSFDMHGVSLTILNAKSLLYLLDALTTAPAWHECDVWNKGVTRPSATLIPEVQVDDAITEMRTPTLAFANFDTLANTMLYAASKALSSSEPILTKYDTIVGDGDCGITMKRGALEVEERLSKGTLPTNHPVPLFAALADAISASMGGTSGILMELFFRKMSSTLSRADQIDATQMSLAFQAGVDAVCLYGGAQVGSRTMLDALVPAAAALVASNDLSNAAEQAKIGAEGTASMKSASAGRSNYLSEGTLEGTPDPGAYAVSIVLKALAKESSS